jgi:tRNA uridine 5-carboxymethylaminomethyl modification enzyme
MARAAVFERLLGQRVGERASELVSLLGDSLRGDVSELRVQTWAQALKRPEVTVEVLWPVLAVLVGKVAELEVWVDHEPTSQNPDVGHPGSWKLPAWVRNEMKTVETEIKYAGYLEQQKRSMERLKRDEGRVIPAWFDYAACSGLSREMVETLGRVRPRTLGQASRIQGVTPAAVTLVNCFIEIQGKRHHDAARAQAV